MYQKIGEILGTCNSWSDSYGFAVLEARIRVKVGQWIVSKMFPKQCVGDYCQHYLLQISCQNDAAILLAAPGSHSEGCHGMVIFLNTAIFMSCIWLGPPSCFLLAKLSPFTHTHTHHTLHDVWYAIVSSVALLGRLLPDTHSSTPLPLQ